jgi:hypothetical protein
MNSWLVHALEECARSDTFTNTGGGLAEIRDLKTSSDHLTIDKAYELTDVFTEEGSSIWVKFGKFPQHDTIESSYDISEGFSELFTNQFRGLNYATNLPNKDGKHEDVFKLSSNLLYKSEPILWRILDLDEEEGKLLLMSNVILWADYFSGVGESYSLSNSDNYIRKFFEDFVGYAFNDAERDAMCDDTDGGYCFLSLLHSGESILSYCDVKATLPGYGTTSRLSEIENAKYGQKGLFPDALFCTDLCVQLAGLTPGIIDQNMSIWLRNDCYSGLTNGWRNYLSVTGRFGLNPGTEIKKGIVPVITLDTTKLAFAMNHESVGVEGKHYLTLYPLMELENNFNFDESGHAHGTPPDTIHFNLVTSGEGYSEFGLELDEYNNAVNSLLQGTIFYTFCSGKEGEEHYGKCTALQKFTAPSPGDPGGGQGDPSGTNIRIYRFRRLRFHRVMDQLDYPPGPPRPSTRPGPRPSRRIEAPSP